MRTTKSLLRRCVAMLLLVACLCAAAPSAFARYPGEGEQTSEVKLLSYRYPQSITVGQSATITVTPASFLVGSIVDWGGDYNGHHYQLGDFWVESKQPDILAVSYTELMGNGWEIGITGVSRGTATVNLNIYVTIDERYELLTETLTITVAPAYQQDYNYYVYAEADVGGSITPELSRVPESGLVTLQLHAEDGYRLKAALICDAEGRLLRTVDYSEQVLKDALLQIAEINETLQVYLICEKEQTSGLHNPFTGLKLEDFDNPFEDVSEDDWFYEALAMMYMAGALDGIDFTEYLTTDSTSSTGTSRQTSSGSSRAAGQADTAGTRVVGYAATTSSACAARSKADDVMSATSSIDRRNKVKFHPEAETGRALTVHELYNKRDCLALTSGSYTKSPFVDVKSGASYFQPVLWASDKDIVNGYGNGYFGPKDSITREQMCAILLRTAQKAGLTMPTTYAATTFTDQSSISSWAKSAVTACQRAGVITGYTDGSFKPKNLISNKESIVMIQRFLNLLPV